MSKAVVAPGMAIPAILAAFTTFLAKFAFCLFVIVLGSFPFLLLLAATDFLPRIALCLGALPVARGKKRPRASRPSEAARAFPRFTRAALFVFLFLVTRFF